MTLRNSFLLLILFCVAGCFETQTVDKGLIHHVSNGKIEIKPRLKYELMLSLHVLRTAEDHHELFIPWAQEMRQSLSEKTLQEATYLTDAHHEYQMCAILSDYVCQDTIEAITEYIENDKCGRIKKNGIFGGCAPTADFLRRYYDEGFGKLWKQEHEKLVHDDAEAIVKELEDLDFSITGYMEEFTGRKFNNSGKIILYPSSFSRPQHAYGFSENGVKVFLYQVGGSKASVIGTGFHELMHSLLDGWENPQRMKKAIDQLTKQELFKKEFEKFKGSYSYPIGCIEEQIVHSIATYMLYKKGYKNEKQTRRHSYGQYEDALYDAIFDKYDSFDNVDDFIYYAISNIKVVGQGKEAHFEYIK